MISDVLSEAVDSIRSYLDHELGDSGYGERGTPLRDWIESTAAQMDALRANLDTSPGKGPVIRGTCRECGKTADIQADYGSCAACISASRARMRRDIGDHEVLAAGFGGVAIPGVQEDRSWEHLVPWTCLGRSSAPCWGTPWCWGPCWRSTVPRFAGRMMMRP
jgi:hypothetical protein